MLKISLFLFFAISLTTNASDLTRLDIRKLSMRSHSPLNYTQIKKLMFSTVDNKKGIVCSAYTPSQCQTRHYNELPKRRNKGFNLNIEHTWPQSKGAKEFPANSDMHHLFVTSKESNSKRANLPFCNAEDYFWKLDGSIQGIDKYAQDCFEPQDKHKGNVARAMFYFSIRYDLPIDIDQELAFREWHISDPVDEQELARNIIIKRLQGNTNPFITTPELVDHIQDF